VARKNDKGETVRLSLRAAGAASDPLVLTGNRPFQRIARMNSGNIRSMVWHLTEFLIGMAILLGGASGGRAEATATSPDTLVGTWKSHRPAGEDTELFLTLRILPDGKAELFTAQAVEGPAFLEKGAWRLRGAAITILVFEEGRPPDPNEMLLEQRDSVLVPVQWNTEFYGRSALGHFLKQPEQKSD